MAPNRRRVTSAILIATVSWYVGAGPSLAATTPPTGWWRWPILGPVLRGFEPPPTPFSSGHRGIDIEAPFGTPVRAPAHGTVTFAGPVGGLLFITIDVGDGYLATSSYLSRILVKKGQVVLAGDVVALSGRGHPEIDVTQLHFGVRLHGAYVDPIPLLEPQSVVDIVRLAPLDAQGSGPTVVLAAPAAPAVPFAPAAARLLRDQEASDWFSCPSSRREVAPALRFTPARAPP